MATTTIRWNGVKLFGDDRDNLDALQARLRDHVLDSRFEPFARNLGRGLVLFYGNFCDVSAAFSVESDDPEVCRRLTDAIKANMATVAYKEARDSVRWPGA